MIVAKAQMILRSEKQIFLPAWGISMLLHGLIMGALFTMSAQVKPVLQKEIFQWDVTLVEGVRSNSHVAQGESRILPQQPHAENQHASAAKRSSDSSHPRTEVKQLESMSAPSQPPVEALHPLESKIESPQQAGPIEQQWIERVETKAEPVADDASSGSTEAQPIQQDSMGATSVPDNPHTAAVDATPQGQAMSAASASGSDVKTDNRWLVESLWRRVAELKHYPSSARLNGQEGKVIVRAVIRSDGRLADVIVQKSSGHSVLDAAALEAVKLACPIHMKQAIGKSQIVVTLPIVYQLSG